MLTDVVQLVRNTTQPYRKGEPITEETIGEVHVTTIDANPSAPKRGRLVDVHFQQIGFTEAVATVTRDDLIEMLAGSTHGEFGDMPLERWKAGPSYIEIGAWIGDQGLALCLMALGEQVGAWEVVTPARLGVTGEAADRMAGMGYVMTSGLRGAA